MTPFPFCFVSFFFLLRPTDPKSENAFDNKRKKRGWPKNDKELSYLPFSGPFSPALPCQQRHCVFVCICKRFCGDFVLSQKIASIKLKSIAVVRCFYL